MKECDYCQHVEMCAWRKDVEEQGCEFFDKGNKLVKDNINEVLDKIRAEIDKKLLSFAKDVEDMGDSARKIRISLGIVRAIIDKYREE